MTGLLVHNVESLPRAGVLNAIFPLINAGNLLDNTSVNTAWQDVQNNYVLRSVSGSLGTQGAERGMVEALQQTYGDRFTTFLTKRDYEAFQSQLNGQRSGSIGIALETRCAGEMRCPDGVTPTEVAVESVLTGQPAERAGLRNGDVLQTVNGQLIASLATKIDDRVSKTAALIRGQPGTTVTLGVTRQSVALTFSIKRADLHIPTTYSQRVGSVLYVQVTQFAAQTGDEVRGQLQSGLNGGARSVVLDLRHNPGGLVDAARAIASQFLQFIPGKEEDVSVRKGRPGSVTHDTIQRGGVATHVALVVLVDENSASAAEIVASALKDYGRGRLVGVKTFGKGSAQVDFPLPDGNDLHLTVEKWFGPKGESIEEQGITPDVPVALSSDDVRFRLDTEGPPAQGDAQLQAALAQLAGY